MEGKGREGKVPNRPPKTPNGLGEKKENLDKPLLQFLLFYHALFIILISTSDEDTTYILNDSAHDYGP